MGNCVTVDAVSSPIHSTKSLNPTINNILPTTNATTINPLSHADKEWNDTIRMVYLIMLDKLAHYLEHENIILSTFASSYRSLPVPSQSNGARAIDIFSNTLLQQFETYLNTVYIIDSSKLVLPDIDSTDLSYPQLQLLNWIQTAQSAELRDPLMTCNELGEKIIKQCQLLQSELNTVAAHIDTVSHDVSVQVRFFSELFTFSTRTNILADPQSLYANIDMLCGATTA